MANAFKVSEDGHARLSLHAADQTFAAARYDHVDGAIEPGEHHAHGLAFAGRNQRDRGLRQTGFGQALDHGGMNGAAGAETLGTAAQDRGITRFEAERACIRGHIRPTFIDDANDAKGNPDALDSHTVRAAPRCHHRSDRVFKFADDVDPLRHGQDPAAVER